MYDDAVLVVKDDGSRCRICHCSEILMFERDFRIYVLLSLKIGKLQMKLSKGSILLPELKMLKVRRILSARAIL
ncbi:hypothetical protein EUGRSUZ_E00677 [Eucalyptus grandis]|uniref:Uncharacterized protein n=2 Tax=Eucalyptus grandis TaxID=71139 RepID=A0ACC3KUP7_EUCGR|nr:hypothetical protein EUGRSUZ_E00677 [Eucalyptus grandis]